MTQKNYLYKQIKELKDIDAGDESNNNALQKEEMTLDELPTSVKQEMAANNYEEGKVVSEIPNQEVKWPHKPVYNSSTLAQGKIEMLLSLFLHDWIALFFLQNVRQANLTTEEANDARGAENVTELSSEEMRVEDCTNKVNEQELKMNLLTSIY